MRKFESIEYPERFPVYTSVSNNVLTIPANTQYTPASFGSDTFADAVKRVMGYVEKPLKKCRHCGQYGAVYCACVHCGAPIDP